MKALNRVLLLACLLTTSALRADVAKPRADWAATGTLWESGQYEYDAAGNVKQVGTDRYTYDQYGRLVSATAHTPSSANTQAFTYDRYGNLKSMTTTTASGTFRGAFAVVPSTNRLDGTCEQPYDVCHSRLHDPDTGAETGRSAAGEYQWDAVGMLKERNADRHERHLYDANDERIVTIEYTGNVEMKRRYSLRGPDNQVLRDLTLHVPANTWTVDRDYVRRGGALMASFTGTDAHPARHYHPDHLGTPRVVTDADGYRLNIHTYLPFGREAEGSEPDPERLKFTGHERDSSGPASPGFDLDYMHARFYDPNVGRFLSLDPTWESADSSRPQTWNRYAYVTNNPINRIDPDGKVELLWNRLKHIITNHINKDEKLHKSKFSTNEPKEVQKLTQKTAKPDNLVKVQSDGRRVYEKTFNKAVGTAGEKTVRVVTQPGARGTEKVITSIPTLNTLGSFANALALTNMGLTIYNYSRDFQQDHGRGPTFGETSRYLMTGDTRSDGQVVADTILRKPEA